MNLTNKTIFITGGALGIGRECVTAYLRAGARVSVLDRDENALNELKAQFSSDVLLALPGDVRQKEDIKTAIEKTVAAFGSLHVIHNNAGIASPSKPLHETSEDEWDSLFDINLKSVYYTTKYGLEYLRQTRGNILNTSSMVGEIGQDNHAAYVASKGGMSALTKAMALDYAPLGIRVNAVCPAGVWDAYAAAMGRRATECRRNSTVPRRHPSAGHCPEGDVIADVAVFLISDAARFVTGCIMPVSAGGIRL